MQEFLLGRGNWCRGIMQTSVEIQWNFQHIGPSYFVLCKEVVLFSEVKNVLVLEYWCTEECPL